jgi:dolichol-phosphate mannosyltransferase
MENIYNEKKSVVVIPCYNEGQNIEILVTLIFQNLKNTDILIINDSSRDNTKEVVEKLAQQYKDKIFIINRIGKRNFGLSYVEGFKWALSKKYDFIFQMDGDGSHHPKFLPALLEQMVDCDLVIGSRYCKKRISTEDWENKRLLFSILANFYARTITRLPINDITGGFKCFKQSTLKSIDLNHILSKGFAFQIEMNWLVYKAGLKIKEIPIVFIGRKYGKSKFSFDKAIEGLWIPIKIIFN